MKKVFICMLALVMIFTATNSVAAKNDVGSLYSKADSWYYDSATEGVLIVKDNKVEYVNDIKEGINFLGLQRNFTGQLKFVSFIPAALPKQMANPNSLVSVAGLKELIGQPNVVVVDCSEKMKDVIPGAIWIDRTKLYGELDGSFRNIESKEVTEQILGEYGIGNDTTVIFYDDYDNLYSTFFLWQLRAYGHNDVRILNGGTKAWLAAGEPVVNEAAVPGPAVTYTASDNVAAIRADLQDVLNATNNPEYTLVDFRPKEDFDEGHIPGAIHFNYLDDLLNEDGTFKTVEEYEELLKNKNVPQDTKIIVYCWGGVWASGMYYVFVDYLGWPEQVQNYNGGWWNYTWAEYPPIAVK